MARGNRRLARARGAGIARVGITGVRALGTNRAAAAGHAPETSDERRVTDSVPYHGSVGGSTERTNSGVDDLLEDCGSLAIPEWHISGTDLRSMSLGCDFAVSSRAFT